MRFESLTKNYKKNSDRNLILKLGKLNPHFRPLFILIGISPFKSFILAVVTKVNNPMMDKIERNQCKSICFFRDCSCSFEYACVSSQ